MLFLKDENLERAERAALGVAKLFSYGGPSTQAKVVFGSVKYAPSAADGQSLIAVLPWWFTTGESICQIM